MGQMKCQLCEKNEVEYDIKLTNGQWAFTCRPCALESSGSYFRYLGKGLGQHHPKKPTCKSFCEGEKI